MKQSLHFSDAFNLDIRGHRDIDFIDINLTGDTKLYLDSCLIEGREDDWGKLCAKTINSFFNYVFKCCLEENYSALYSVLNFGHEPNETRLGMSTDKPRGNGASANILINVFKDIINEELLIKGAVKYPMDVTIFVKKFDKDRMSDLLTNILRNQLYKFTLEQCEKYDIKLSNEILNIGKYWDINTESWQELRGKSLSYRGEKILLVPKDIVRNNYFYSVKSFIWKKVIEYRQSYHYENKTNLIVLKYDKNDNPYYDKPTKVSVYKEEIKGHSQKELSREFVENNNKSIEEYRELMQQMIQSKKYVLSDDILDKIVYKRKIKIA